MLLKPLAFFRKSLFAGSLMFLLWGLFCLFGGITLAEWTFRKSIPDSVVSTTIVGMPLAMLATLSGTVAHSQQAGFRKQTIIVTLALTLFFALIAYGYLFVPQSDG